MSNTTTITTTTIITVRTISHLLSWPCSPTKRGNGKDRGPVGPDSLPFYFRRFLAALMALSTPLSEPSVRFLPFLPPDTFSLAAFVPASLIFLPMLATSTTFL